jgi:predicted nucleic acid-binding protein
MSVVSNTSPLLNLAIIERISFLQEQFGQILIPPGVLEELRVQENLPGSQGVREALEAGWLRVQEVEDRHLVRVLQGELDKWEAEAIALGLQVGAEWTLLDEREGRKVAKTLGLKVTGVLGVLLRARRMGKLPSVRQALEDLRLKAGFRISEEVVEEVLKQAGEV